MSWDILLVFNVTRDDGGIACLGLAVVGILIFSEIYLLNFNGYSTALCGSEIKSLLLLVEISSVVILSCVMDLTVLS